MVPRSWWWKGVAGLLLVASLPFIGQFYRTDRESCCNWDGLALNPLYRVRVISSTDNSKHFCSVQCAVLWLSRNRDKVARILVTDEVSGTEMDAADAVYVRSSIVTNRITGNRIHVFRTEVDAQKHAEAANGRKLSGSERPFNLMRQRNPGIHDDAQ